LRRPVTDVALLAYIAKKNASVVSYTEATKACKSSSSASRALHQLIGEGILEPKPKLLGLRYVTQYMVTPRGKQVAQLALQLTELREAASKSNPSQVRLIGEKSKNSRLRAANSKKGSKAKKNKQRQREGSIVDSSTVETVEGSGTA
jgi:hypothetical protein